MPLVAAPLWFGQDPRDFTWIQWPSSQRWAEQHLTDSLTFTHYRSWFPQKRGVQGAVAWPVFQDIVRNQSMWQQQVLEQEFAQNAEDERANLADGMPSHRCHSAGGDWGTP